MGSESLQLMGASAAGSIEPATVAVSLHEAVRTPAPAPKPDVPDAPVEQDQIRRFAEMVGEAVSRLNHGIRFEIDESTNSIITKIIDRETNEVIRQIPPEEMMDMLHRVRQYIGVLLDIQA